MKILLLLCVCFLWHFILVLSEYPYCFRFTWIGPYDDKENLNKLTCDDLREDASNIPCRLPLVATENDTIPDTLYLWQKYQATPTLFGCPMTPGQSCVKFTYIYKKGVQNITYMCAKVNTTNGCYRQHHISGLDVEVCVCSSQRSALPCNAAPAARLSQHGLIYWTLGVTLTIVIYAIR